MGGESEGDEMLARDVVGNEICGNDKITVREAREKTVKIFLGTLG